MNDKPRSRRRTRADTSPPVSKDCSQDRVRSGHSVSVIHRRYEPVRHRDVELRSRLLVSPGSVNVPLLFVEETKNDENKRCEISGEVNAEHRFGKDCR